MSTESQVPIRDIDNINPTVNVGMLPENWGNPMKSFATAKSHCDSFMVGQASPGQKSLFYHSSEHNVYIMSRAWDKQILESLFYEELQNYTLREYSENKARMAFVTQSQSPWSVIAQHWAAINMPASAEEQFSPHLSLKDRIHDLQETASVEGWDGDGALALNPETIDHAVKFVHSLPRDIPMPDVGASPHGEINFEWVLSREAMLSVSMCPDGTIAFAAKFPDERMRNTVLWSETMPDSLSVALNKLKKQSRGVLP